MFSFIIFLSIYLFIQHNCFILTNTPIKTSHHYTDIYTVPNSLYLSVNQTDATATLKQQSSPQGFHPHCQLHPTTKIKRKNCDEAEARKNSYISFVWLMSPPWSSFLNSYIKIKIVHIYEILCDVVMQGHIVDAEVRLGKTCLFLQVFIFCIIKAFKILSPNLDAYTLPLY